MQICVLMGNFYPEKFYLVSSHEKIDLAQQKTRVKKLSGFDSNNQLLILFIAYSTRARFL